MSLTSLLEKHVLKEDILDVNRGLGIRASGTKAELIKALLSETDRSPKGTLRLFSKPVLQEVCRKLGVSPSGTKEQLISRITAAEDKPIKAAPKKTPKKAEASDEAKKEQGASKKDPILKVRLIPKGEKKAARP